MNVGQILETHLGWACAGLGTQIGRMLDEVERGAKADVLRKKLKDVYGDKPFNDDISANDDDGINALNNTLSHGSPTATPAFSVRHQADITLLLETDMLTHSGQMTLREGCVGREVARKVK